MDNLRKREYANFNNKRRDSRGYPPRRNSNMNNADYNNRNGYGNRSSRSDRNVKVQYSGKSSSNNPLVNVYDNISNTVQKKFNNVLYKGQNNNNTNRRQNCNMDRNMQPNMKRNIRIDEDISTKIEDEAQATIPKSIFVFITIAVVFATCLVIILSTKEEDSNLKVADNKNQSSIKVKQYDEDGFQNYAELTEEEKRLLEEAEDSYLIDENGQTTSNNDKSISTEDNKNNKNDKTNKTTTSSTTNNTTSTNKTTTNLNVSGGTTTTSTSNVPSNDVQYNTVSNNNITDTNVPRATISPEEDDNESDEELVSDNSNGGTFTIPCSVPSQGSLYRCSYPYASVGSDGKFIRYTKFTNEPYGTSIQKNDLNGMWLFSRGLALSESSVSSVYGYRNGIRVDVCKITIKVNGTTKKRSIYAMKGTDVPLTDGSYKVSGTSTYIRSIRVTGDVTIIEY